MQTIDQETGMVVADDHAIVPLSDVEAFLATRPPVQTAKELRDRLAALTEYYRGNVKVYDEVYAGQLRTERYIGALLAEMPNAPAGWIAKNGSSGDTMSPEDPPTLADLGFTNKQSSRLQQLAAVPEERFNAYIAERTEAAERIVKADLFDDDDRSRMKPKINRAGDVDEPKGFDVCQTPPEAIDPLLPYIPERAVIWEPACGECSLVDAFYDAGHDVIASDIHQGQNFFNFDPDGWDYLITNPPYSIKYQWLERCYKLGRPFALLLPVETLGAKAAQTLFIQYGVQVILLNKRINFKMPNIGWDGSSAQFPVAWFTWGMDLETQIVFGTLP